MFACFGSKTAARCLTVTGRPLASEYEPGRIRARQQRQHRDPPPDRMPVCVRVFYCSSGASPHLYAAPSVHHSPRVPGRDHHQIFHAEPGLLEISGCHPGPLWCSSPRCDWWIAPITLLLCLRHLLVPIAISFWVAGRPALDKTRFFFLLTQFLISHRPTTDQPFLSLRPPPTAQIPTMQYYESTPTDTAILQCSQAVHRPQLSQSIISSQPHDNH